MKSNIVVTGIGVISAIGSRVDGFLQGLKENRSGVANITKFNTSAFRTGKAAVIPAVHQEEMINQNDPCVSFLRNACEQALTDSQIDLKFLDADRVGCAIASSLGCVDTLESVLTKGNTKADIHFVPHCIPGSIVAEWLGITGPVFTVDTACASGSTSIAYATDIINSGRCDVVLAGGVDVISALSLGGFSAMMNLSKTYCRPFSKERDGLVLGEGAAILILESRHHAQKRMASTYCSILGYGLSNEAFHETRPDPEAKGAILSMTMALKDAGLEPSAIDYINAHGTGTRANDQAEATAIRSILGAHAPKVAISSIKAAVGHTLGAAGSIEAVAVALAIKHDFAPATLNFMNPLPGFEDLNFVGNEYQQKPIHYAISNSFGFAGNTCAILFGK